VEDRRLQSRNQSLELVCDRTHHEFDCHREPEADADAERAPDQPITAASPRNIRRTFFCSTPIARSTPISFQR